MSIDANQKECGQILNSVTTLGTIDKKKDELRARNREYQRQYRERRKNKVCIGDQNLAPGNNPVTKEKKTRQSSVADQKAYLGRVGCGTILPKLYPGGALCKYLCSIQEN